MEYVIRCMASSEPERFGTVLWGGPEEGPFTRHIDSRKYGVTVLSDLMQESFEIVFPATDGEQLFAGELELLVTLPCFFLGPQGRIRYVFSDPRTNHFLSSYTEPFAGNPHAPASCNGSHVWNVPLRVPEGEYRILIQAFWESEPNSEAYNTLDVREQTFDVHLWPTGTARRTYRNREGRTVVGISDTEVPPFIALGIQGARALNVVTEVVVRNEDYFRQNALILHERRLLPQRYEDYREALRGFFSHDVLWNSRLVAVLESLGSSHQPDNSTNSSTWRVHLLTDEARFRRSFSRFANDKVTGLTPAKLLRRGHEAIITQVFDDGSVSCLFNDSVKLDFPIESAADSDREWLWEMSVHSFRLACHTTILQAGMSSHKDFVSQQCQQSCLNYFPAEHCVDKTSPLELDSDLPKLGKTNKSDEALTLIIDKNSKI